MTGPLFYAFGAIAVVGALGMVLSVRNTVAGAMSLVATMVALGGIYVLLEAYLVAALQILVYAGAILVLFLFVVMLLNLRDEALSPARERVWKNLGAVLSLLLLVQFLRLVPGNLAPAAATPEGFGGYRQVGMLLFTDYLLAFELTSLLLLGGMVGAVILAKRDAR